MNTHVSIPAASVTTVPVAIRLLALTNIEPSGTEVRKRRHPLVPCYEQHGIRRCVHADYLIFYRVGAELVEVIHILHGAQDYEPLLFPKT
jgi:plasmid stabilization system protein ParE